MIEEKGRAPIILFVAVLAGVSYMLPAVVDVSGPAVIAWKGTGVALLAAYAAQHVRNIDGWLLVAVLAFGALGDVLIEAAGFVAGGAAFATGHGLAIALYVRNRRRTVTPSQQWLGVLIAPATVLIAWFLTVTTPGGLGVVIYAVMLGMMASTAWVSRFPRYRTGVGAMLFVASDLLIFARMGPLATSSLPGLLIWPLYFAGQVLVTIGVVRTLMTEERGSTP